MNQLADVWSTLSAKRRLTVIGATAAVFLGILSLAWGAGQRDMALLYAGLDSATAGDVVTALDQRGVAYEVRGSSIFVATTDRDTLRMTLAAEGLPANSSNGYELLDNLSGFGTTSQMFDAAYWRAKEGELARTMLASPHIRAARVHISVASNQSFRRQESPTAAVTVTTAHGRLDDPQVEALRYLVASSVPGLDPQDVAVIDGSTGLIQGAGTPNTLGAADDRAERLRDRVQRLLAARVGPGNVVVEVSLETVTETESIVERRVDPDSRVAISREVSESTNKSEDSRGGDVTVASNLPEGDGAGSDGRSSNENAESREVTNFELSETQREVLRTPGGTRRLSVAVLVNAVEVVADDGSRDFVPRPEEELADLKELVASAVGFDESRGDQITLRSMAFEPANIEGTGPEDAAVPSTPLDMMRLIQVGVIAVVTLVLGLFVVRPILAGNSAPAAAVEGPAPAMALTDQSMSEAEGAIPLTDQAMDDLPRLAPPDATADSEQDLSPVDRLRDLIDERRDEALQVLQSWVEDPQGETS